MTKLRVLVLSFPDFMDISIVRILITLETLDSWELRNMSHELYLLCIIEHTVYNNVIFNVLVVSTFSANFPTHLTNFYLTPENYQPYLFYYLVYMHNVTCMLKEEAFGAHLLPNFWNRCGSNHQPTLVGDQCREKPSCMGNYNWDCKDNNLWWHN
jgi:hypothetical protein